MKGLTSIGGSKIAEIGVGGEKSARGHARDKDNRPGRASRLISKFGVVVMLLKREKFTLQSEQNFE